MNALGDIHREVRAGAAIRRHLRDGWSNGSASRSTAYGDDSAAAARADERVARSRVRFRPGDEAAHLMWIDQLLEWYYDPMYDHQLTAKQERVVRTGDRTTVAAYLQTVTASLIRPSLMPPPCATS